MLNWILDNAIALAAFAIAVSTLIWNIRKELPHHKLTAHMAVGASIQGNEPQQNHKFGLLRFQCINKSVSIESIDFHWADAKKYERDLRISTPSELAAQAVVSSGFAEMMPILGIRSIRLVDGDDRSWVFSLNLESGSPGAKPREIVAIAKPSRGKLIKSKPFVY